MILEKNFKKKLSIYFSYLQLECQSIMVGGSGKVYLALVTGVLEAFNICGGFGEDEGIKDKDIRRRYKPLKLNPIFVSSVWRSSKVEILRRHSVLRRSLAAVGFCTSLIIADKGSG